MCTLSPEALDVLRGYAWPGNVRELENVLERAVMFSSGDRIEPDALGGLMSDPAASEVPKKGMAQIAAAANQGIVSATPVPGVFRVEPKMDAPAGLEDVVDTDNWPTLADVERLHLERTLAATVHNKSLAAKMLGIDRSVLRRKLVRYGLLAEDEE